MLREIDVAEVTEAVRALCIESNYYLGDDICAAIAQMQEKEESPLAADILGKLLENMEASATLQVPICQDTGMAVVFLDIGQDVHFTGGDLTEAVNSGVRAGYLDGYLRCSVVTDPIERVNSDDNTPAVLHTRIVPGDKVLITVAPKGFGSENMSRVKMFNPSASAEDILQFIVETVDIAGSNPCPPVVVGVCIGGTFEMGALMAKRALLRPINTHNPHPLYKKLEEDALERINKLGIGPQGFGGRTTALGVNIEKYATHIAGLPVAVNIGCHVTRHKSCML